MMLWHKVPQSIYFRRGSMATAMEDLKGFQRVCIVTKKSIYQGTGFVQELIDLLKARHLEHTNRTLDYQVFYEAADATEFTIQKGFDVIQNFEPGMCIMSSNDPMMVLDGHRLGRIAQ